MRKLLSSTIVAACALGLAAPAANAVMLTILHNNDGESQLINAGSGLENFGGAARFVTLVDQIRSQRLGAGNSVLTLSSGDNILPGPEFNASLNNGVFYDAQVLNAIGYDAIALGNHDFDFGPDLLADFIGDVNAPYVSANLDFSGNAAMQSRFLADEIVKSTVVTSNGVEFGIVGATTENLPFISSPGDVSVLDVVTNVQAEIDALESAGVENIVLISHLQGIGEDVAVIGQLSGVDIAIAGGGDEFLADGPDALNTSPDDVFGPYPLTSFDPDGDGPMAAMTITNLDGTEVPVVTTQGNYRYLGVLDVEFDGNGNLVGIDNVTSGAQLVTDAIAANAAIQSQVIDPVSQALAELANTPIATSEVALDGQRSSIRFEETNLGNLIADSYIFNAEQVNEERGGTLLTGDAVVAVANGGGIRNDSVLSAGVLTELDTFDILPFSNTLTVINDLTASDLLAVLENAVSRVEGTLGGTGRFAQVAGLEFTYDPARAAGDRVLELLLADGTLLYDRDGFLDVSTLIDLVTVDFLAGGGDEYPLDGFDGELIGISYQRSLFNYIVDALGGVVTAAQYAEGGEGRITAVSEPGSIALLGFGFLGLAGLYRRKRA